jgi:hypothetical protein
MVENFSYSTGQLTTVSGGTWVNFSGTANFIQVSSGSLTYPNYIFGGNKIDIVATTSSAEDAYREFTAQTTIGTTVYAAFLVNVANTTLLPANSSTTGEYFAGFLSSTSTTALDARVSIRLGSTAGTYQLGMRASSVNATTTFSSTDLTPGNTVLVVISYQLVNGTANDVVNMWINPALGGSEPAPDITQVSASDIANVSRFFVRQGTASGVSTPNASIDGIRVGTTWESVTGTVTAANGTVSGRVTKGDGSPVSGATVRLSGDQNRVTITDGDGRYAFTGVETDGFYVVTPSRANYVFTPASRSFSHLALNTDAAFTAAATAETENPLDTDIFFVRQQYLDFLGREPDAGGLAYWTDQISRCGADAACRRTRRNEVSAAFFMSEEFEKTGSYIYRLYKAALGRQLTYGEFSADRARIPAGPGLEESRAAFAREFVERAEISQKYQPATTADSFVDALIENVRQASGVDLSAARSSLIGKYQSGGTVSESRSLVLREIVESTALKEQELNPSFVLMEYFGYLKRDPEEGGRLFWLNVLDQQDRNNYLGMVCSFVTSAEYQSRFSSFVAHSNQECGQ